MVWMTCPSGTNDEVLGQVLREGASLRRLASSLGSGLFMSGPG